MAKKANFDSAVRIDEKHHSVRVDHKEILKIIDEFIQLGKFNLKFTPNTIIDGYGTIAVRL